MPTLSPEILKKIRRYAYADLKQARTSPNQEIGICQTRFGFVTLAHLGDDAYALSGSSYTFTGNKRETADELVTHVYDLQEA